MSCLLSIPDRFTRWICTDEGGRFLNLRSRAVESFGMRGINLVEALSLEMAYACQLLDAVHVFTMAPRTVVLGLHDRMYHLVGVVTGHGWPDRTNPS